MEYKFGFAKVLLTMQQEDPSHQLHTSRIYGAGPDHDQKPPGSNDPLQDLYIGQPVYNPPGTYQYAPEIGEMVLWVTNAGACDICTDNAEAGPVSYGTPFPSGDTEPPAHNHCWCTLSPAGEKPGPSGPGEYLIWPDDYQPRPRGGRGK